MAKMRARGFTLIELMITVAILGILAAIAIPSFGAFIARSKTAEASANLGALFKTAASYYYSGDRGRPRHCGEHQQPLHGAHRRSRARDAEPPAR